MTKEILLPLHDSDANRAIIRSIPEADLVFTLRDEGTLEFWCLKERALVWSFDLESVLDHSVKIPSIPALDYELDRQSSIKIAMFVPSMEG